MPRSTFLRGLFRSARFWWLFATLLLLVVAYAVFGYRFAPGLIRSQAITFVRDTYHRELEIGAVRVDPFRLQLEVHDLRLPDADRQTLLAFKSLLVDLEVSSLWHRAWVFRTVQFDAPVARVVMRGDGRINLVDLARPGPVAAPADAPMPRVWIQSLAITQGRAEYAQIARRQRPIVRRVEPVNFSLQDFRTTSEGGRFVFSARTAADEEFSWRGRFALAPHVTSQGEFSVARLRVAGLTELLAESTPVGVGSGQIALAGRYEFALGQTVTFNAQIPDLQVTELRVRPAGGDADWISIPLIRVEQIVLDGGARRLHAQRLGIDGLRVDAWLDESRQLNLQRLWQAPGAPVAMAEVSGARAAPRADAWSADIDHIELRAAGVDFEDRSLRGKPRFTVKPLDVSIANASLDLSKPLPVTLAARINDAATLKLGGELTPAPLAARLDVSLRDARAQWPQPYVLPMADLTIRSGTVSVAGQLALLPGAKGTTDIRFDGDGELRQLRSIDNTLQEDLLNVGRLQVQKLHYGTAPAGLSIARILVQEPYARLVISPEQIVNISAVLDPGAAAARLAEYRAAQEGSAPAARKESRSERRARERAESERRKARAATPLPPESTAPEAFPIRIGEVRVAKGRMNFSDLSIRPSFSAEIQGLEGAVKTLSSARSSRATVDLKGNLGEFSPVTIDGTLRPFAFDRFSDIGVKFENIALPVFNPYSGVFAGFNIAKGRLDTELHYQISDRKLIAAHHLRIDQLEWGEASQFKGEATLPVKFATALLRDRHGVIDLDLPVTGSLDDPKFKVGPIVWQVIRNIIVKAATAPFALLGSLFAGAEEAQFVDFRPGDATLDAATTGRLAQLAKGLAEKSGISLDVPLAVAPELDRPALLERRYQQQLDAAAAALPGTAQPQAQAAAYAGLGPQQKREALTTWLQQQRRTLPPIPAFSPPEGASRAEARELADQAAVTFLEQQLRTGITVTDDELEQLAQSRAAAIQGALLAPGELEATRVFVVREPSMQVKDQRIRLQLNLK